MQVQDKALYLEALLDAMWDYGFIHRDLEGLLGADPELAARYRLFAGRCLQHARRIYQGFVEAGILLADEMEIDALALNAWIVLTSWVRFLGTACAGAGSGQLDRLHLRRGIYQVLALESGLVAADAAEVVRTLQEQYFVASEQILL